MSTTSTTAFVVVPPIAATAAAATAVSLSHAFTSSSFVGCARFHGRRSSSRALGTTRVQQTFHHRSRRQSGIVVATSQSDGTNNRESLVDTGAGNNGDPTVEIVPPDSTRIPEMAALDPESGSVTIPATFNLAAAFLLAGGASCYAGNGWVVLGLPVSAIGVLLAVQTFRIRFVFGPTRVSVAMRKSDGTLDIIRGWEYERITNWEMWWKGLPVLAYFKETESYNGRGSVHFFPMLCDGKQLVEQFRQRTPHLDKKEYDWNCCVQQAVAHACGMT